MLLFDGTQQRVMQKVSPVRGNDGDNNDPKGLFLSSVKEHYT